MSSAAELGSLLDAPAPAVIVLYRTDGEAIVSPVWFRVHDGSFEVVIAAGDRKLDHLRRDPRCILLVFETERPFRGVQVRGRASLAADEEGEARLAIASRYLGPDDGARYAAPGRRPPGVIVRLPTNAARSWDLSASLPGPD